MSYSAYSLLTVTYTTALRLLQAISIIIMMKNVFKVVLTFSVKITVVLITIKIINIIKITVVLKHWNKTCKAICKLNDFSTCYKNVIFDSKERMPWKISSVFFLQHQTWIYSMTVSQIRGIVISILLRTDSSIINICMDPSFQWFHACFLGPS